MAAMGAAAQDEALGHLIENVRKLGANTVMIHAYAALSSPGAPLGDVFFPTSLRPLRADLLSRVTWQLRSRAGSKSTRTCPSTPPRQRSARTRRCPLCRHGQVHRNRRHRLRPGVDAGRPAVVPSLPGEIRARRAALNLSAFTGHDRLLLEAYRATAELDPRQRLMVTLNAPGPPPEWADFGLLPQSRDVAETAGLARRLRAEGWLRPDVAGRIAFALPAEPRLQVEALRRPSARAHRPSRSVPTSRRCLRHRRCRPPSRPPPIPTVPERGDVQRRLRIPACAIPISASAIPSSWPGTGSRAAEDLSSSASSAPQQDSAARFRL